MNRRLERVLAPVGLGLLVGLVLLGVMRLAPADAQAQEVGCVRTGVHYAERVKVSDLPALLDSIEEQCGQVLDIEPASASGGIGAERFLVVYRLPLQE